MIAVQTERFEIPRRQFKQLFIFAGVLAGVGVVLDLLALVVFGKVLLMPLMWGIGLTLAGAFALYAAMAYTRAYTEITADGIRTRGLYGTKRATWADVKDITVYNPRNQGVDTIKIRLFSGKTFQLGAPTNSPVMSDPEFAAKMERIVAAWHSGVAARN